MPRHFRSFAVAASAACALLATRSSSEGEGKAKTVSDAINYRISSTTEIPVTSEAGAKLESHNSAGRQRPAG
jgi:hypothetical protein